MQKCQIVLRLGNYSLLLFAARHVNIVISIQYE